MQEFRYEIVNINEEDRWVLLHTYEGDYDEADSFVYLVKKIRKDLGGNIIEVGIIRYKIDTDPLRLTYQWDSCFGITIVYPYDVSKKMVIEFLKKYL